MKLIKLPFLLLTGSIFMISCGDNKDEKKIVQKEEKLSIETLQDSIRKLSEELSDARYFDIQFMKMVLKIQKSLYGSNLWLLI